MRSTGIVLTLSTIGLLSGSCEPDDGDVSPSGAHLTFRTDSGYTYQSDTITLSDTLQVGLEADAGYDPLVRFYLNVSYDDSSYIWKDTIAISTDPFVYEATLIARDEAGKEQWSFIVEEPDGDRTLRKLTFTVQ